MNEPTLDEWRQRNVADLLHQAGLRGEFVLRPLDGGANNKVFRVDLPETRLLYKEYFHHPDDTRDRLRNEYSFVSFAWQNGIRALPMPLGQVPAQHCALFEFVSGRKLEPAEVSQAHVLEALRFFQQVNEFKRQDEAQLLPKASEACFTIQEHCQCVERRIARLTALEPVSPVEKEAFQFAGALAESWRQVREQVSKQAKRAGVAEDTPLPHEDRCISPSDFGFHNALFTPDSTLKFIDFEYAGWDDPAKTVCDFFCQPERPAPLACFDLFGRGVARSLTNPKRQLERFRLLLPVYQMKWCCIMLNDFLPAGASRRQFAKGGQAEERQRTQLAKARLALAGLEKRQAA
jgi:hypothetical protein